MLVSPLQGNEGDIEVDVLADDEEEIDAGVEKNAWGEAEVTNRDAREFVGVLGTMDLAAEEEDILNISRSPSSSPEPTIHHIDSSSTVQGHDLPRSDLPLDLINRWPHPLPSYLLHPINAGSSPNPYSSPSTKILTGPSSFLHDSLPLLAHALSGTLNSTRRAVELTLQIASSTIRLGENLLFERFKSWYRREHPDAPPDVLERLDELDPTFEPLPAPRTLQSALRSLGITQDLIVHPVCPD